MYYLQRREGVYYYRQRLPQQLGYDIYELIETNILEKDTINRISITPDGGRKLVEMMKDMHA